MKDKIREVVKSLEPKHRRQVKEEVSELCGVSSRTANELYLRDGEVPEEFRLSVLSKCIKALKLQVEELNMVLKGAEKEKKTEEQKLSEPTL